MDLVKQNGFYLYEYMSDFEKFKEELPSRKKFYSSWTDRRISDKEYEHVLNIRKIFEMKTTKDYHNLYLKCAVLLSAYVLETFRNNSLKNYELCPSHYLSAPGLSWDEMLKMKNVELQITFRYVPDQYKTQQMYDKAILENEGTLTFVPDCYKN